MPDLDKVATHYTHGGLLEAIEDGVGKTAPVKIGNMVENITRKRIAPVELIAAKPA